MLLGFASCIATADNGNANHHHRVFCATGAERIDGNRQQSVASTPAKYSWIQQHSLIISVIHHYSSSIVHFMHKRNYSCIFLLLMTLIPAHITAQEMEIIPAAKPIDHIVAIVNEDVITRQ